MELNRIENPLSRIERNKLNENFEIIKGESDNTRQEFNQKINIAKQEINREFDNVERKIEEAKEVSNALLDAEIDNAALQTDIQAKLNQLEEDYAPQLTSVTEQLVDSAKINSQIDFVDFVKDYSEAYTKMKFLKSAENSYQVQLHNDKKGVIYDFSKDTNDDYIKLNAGYAGLEKNGDGFVSKDVITMSDTNGTWLTSGANFYTTTAGDNFTLSAEGEKLTLTINTEARGGMWSISVDGGVPVNISCYSTTTGEKDVVIAEGLTNTMHTVVGTFMGDDPQNPPSSSPSRGYLRAVDLSEKGTLTGFEKASKNTAENTILATASNKEFAFTVSKNGSINWIPEHDGIGSVFNVSSPQFYMDGELIDVSNMQIGSSFAIEGNTFELKQHVKGHIVGYGEVMELRTSHIINKEGVLNFNGSMLALTDFTSTAYPMMLPSQNEYMNMFLSGILNSKTNDGSENYSYFTDEKDRVYSGAIVSPNKKNLIAAGTLKYPLKTYRMGKLGKPSAGQDLFLWNRATKPKMYFQSMKDNPIKTNDYYAWGFQLVIADIDNIFDLITA